MSRQVKGYLAKDGTFFESAANCDRHDAWQELKGLCESHGLNFDNFVSVLNSWHKTIREYYNADSKCENPFATGEPVRFEDGLPPVEIDNEDVSIGDKDAPGFLEQQARRNF